jgi:ABC-type polysaccharide/polyol phosphate export permease
MMTSKKSLEGDVYDYNADADYRATIGAGLADLWAGLCMYRIWMRLGWRDMKQQTHRMALGPLWSILGTGIQVAALGYVYGALLKTAPQNTFPFIAAGLIIWFFVAACLIGGLSVFLNDASVLSETELPISLSVFRYVCRLFIELLYKFIVFILVAIWAGLVPNWNMLLFIPGLALFVLNGVWIVLLLGVAGARFWDLRELVAPLMLIAFLATPVLWHPEVLAENSHIATYNPLTHFLDILREPLLGHVPDPVAYIVVISFLVVGWICALVTFGLYRNRIVYWL